MSESNRVQLSFIKEATAGVTPAGNLTPIPFTGESLKGAVESTESQIIRADGNVPDVIRTDLVPQGGFNSELGVGFYDPLIEGAFRNTFDTAILITETTISYTAGAPNTLDDSGDGFGAIQVDDIVNVQGFTNGVNNGLSLVVSAAVGSLGVIPLDPSKPGINESAGASVTITSQRMRNGIEDHFFSMEKAMLDKASSFLAFRGMMVDTLQIAINAKAVLTSVFAFLGQGHTTESSTIGAGYDPLPAGDSMNSVNHFVGTLLEHNQDGTIAPPSGCITKIDMNISNSVRRDVGLNCTTMGKGKFMITVSWEAFFETLAVYEQYVADGTTSLAFGVLDGSLKGYAFYLPKVRYTDGDIMAGGGDQPVVAKFSGQAVLFDDGSGGYSMMMFKLA